MATTTIEVGIAASKVQPTIRTLTRCAPSKNGICSRRFSVAGCAHDVCRRCDRPHAEWATTMPIARTMRSAGLNWNLQPAGSRPAGVRSAHDQSAQEASGISGAALFSRTPHQRRECKRCPMAQSRRQRNERGGVARSFGSLPGNVSFRSGIWTKPTSAAANSATKIFWCC